MTVDDGDRMIVFGVIAVTEALRAGQVRAVRIATASARVQISEAGSLGTHTSPPSMVASA